MDIAGISDADWRAPVRIAVALPLISLGLVACEAPAAEGEADGTASTPPALENLVKLGLLAAVLRGKG